MFSDPGLTAMLKEAMRFQVQVMTNQPPFWLSYLGPSGIGKTFLSKIIFETIKDVRRIAYHNTLVHGAMRVVWPKMISRLYSGEHWMMDDCREANLLLIDDVSSSADKSGFERESLWKLFCDRMGKWTIITSNLKLAEIASKIDTRIASRMMRDGNTVVEVEAKDFSLR